MFQLTFHGQRLNIDREITYIGRDPSCCHIVISDDTEVSRRHVCLIDLGHKVILLDYKSSNGTLLNSVQVEQEVLKPGDQITVGKTVITAHVPQPPRVSRHITAEGYKTFLSTEDYNVGLKKAYDQLRNSRDGAVSQFFPYIDKIKNLTDTAEICRETLEVGMALSGSDRGFAMLVGDGPQGLDMACKIGLEEDYFLRRNLHWPLIDEALKNQRIVVTKDLFLKKVFDRNTLVLPNVCSAIAVPVIYLGHPIGIFYTDRRIASGAYQENDIRNLIFATYQSSAYLGNQRLMVPFKGQEDMLEILDCALHGEGFVYCEVCGEKIERGSVPLVTCLKCETFHHKDCWEYNNRCAIYGCAHTEAKPVPLR
jgi:hypothetical protein